MPIKIGASRRLAGVQEERQFTNPHIRFRRIRGRVVPIVNRKRIGQDLNKGGRSLIKAGVATAALGALSNRTKLGRGSRELFSNLINSEQAKSVTSIFYKRMGSLLSKHTPKTIIGRVGVAGIARSAKGAMNAAKFVATHPTKLGLAISALGLGSVFLGTELEVNSPFGKDFFFLGDK